MAGERAEHDTGAPAKQTSSASLLGGEGPTVSKQIEGWLQEMFGRDITHAVKHKVKDDTGVAFTMACRYADGTHVVCATVIALDGEKIREQTVVQAWDEK